MKTKIIITVVILGVFAVGAALLPKAASNDVSQQAMVGSLEANETFFDFGTIQLSAGDVETQYTLTNTGEAPVTVGKVYTSCMCTTASLIESDGTTKGLFGMPGHKGQLPMANTVVQPGEKITVNAVYDPAAHGPAGVGLAQRSIYLETDSKETPKVELRLKAMVIN